ncbi:MAG: phenylacetate-CoA oxygenase subunit PaaJ, partial [Proteobacteria bacterium]|nr:phenylacetate-CoA oxygenase subunit PaaJ [Pseudomonadota bacterium]
MPSANAAEARKARAWAVLHTVADPEIPVLSLCDLGIVRDVRHSSDGVLDVVLTPTYSGCPATELIARSVAQALECEGLGPVRISQQRAPAWSSDWISAEGLEKMRRYGIAPPAG